MGIAQLLAARANHTHTGAPYDHEHSISDLSNVPSIGSDGTVLTSTGSSTAWEEPVTGTSYTALNPISISASNVIRLNTNSILASHIAANAVGASELNTGSSTGNSGNYLQRTSSGMEWANVAAGSIDVTSEDTLLADEDRFLITNDSSTYTARFTRLDTLRSSFLTSSITPGDIGTDTTNINTLVGDSIFGARANHFHQVNYGETNDMYVGSDTDNNQGSVDEIARIDHRHTSSGVTLTFASSTVSSGATGGDGGSGTDVSHANHRHGVRFGSAVDIGTSNTAGSGSLIARSNHVHAGLAADAITYSTTALFLGADSSDDGDDDTTSRGDHIHGINYGETEDMYDGSLTDNNQGSVDEVARIDHRHEGGGGGDLSELDIRISSLQIRLYENDTTNTQLSSTQFLASPISSYAPDPITTSTTTTTLIGDITDRAARADHTHTLPSSLSSTYGLSLTTSTGVLNIVAGGSDSDISILGNDDDDINTINQNPNDAGVLGLAARIDHRHDIARAITVPTPSAINDANKVLTVVGNSYDWEDPVTGGVQLSGSNPSSIGISAVVGGGLTASPYNHVHRGHIGGLADRSSSVGDSPIGYGFDGQVLTMNGSTEARWDDLPSGITLDFSPSTVSSGASGGDGGSGTDVSHANHRHGVNFGSAVSIGTSNTAGTGSLIARSNHVHAASAAAGVTYSLSAEFVDEDIGDDGQDDTVSRGDHRHGINYGETSDMYDGSLTDNNQGTVDEVARIDHRHEGGGGDGSGVTSLDDLDDVATNGSGQVGEFLYYTGNSGSNRYSWGRLELDSSGNTITLSRDGIYIDDATVSGGTTGTVDFSTLDLNVLSNTLSLRDNGSTISGSGITLFKTASSSSSSNITQQTYDASG